MCRGLDVNKSVNSQINLIFVGAFQSKCLNKSFQSKNYNQICQNEQTLWTNGCYSYHMSGFVDFKFSKEHVSFLSALLVVE